MPASLTVQVRLGFSMGWRIWTPNEVGFYAKTLAHSYFILVILKSKFLKELIWIVNYNLFMGTKKYHVFIEFLQFGMKSTEERCVWKKIIFISLVARHKKMTKAYFNYKDQRYKLNLIKSGLAKMYPYKGDQKAVLKVYESKLFRGTRLGLKQTHEKYIRQGDSFNFKHSVNLGNSRSPILLKKRQLLKTSFFLKYFEKRSLSVSRYVSKSISIYKKHFSKKINKNVTLLSKKNKSMFYTKYLVKSPNLKYANRSLFRSKDRELVTGVSESGLFISEAEKTLMESFRFDPIYMKNTYSFVGGPRKRLSRNLRRAFKGKHVKVASDLVWFWEKISRMVTYLVQKHVFYQKRLF